MMLQRYVLALAIGSLLSCSTEMEQNSEHPQSSIESNDINNLINNSDESALDSLGNRLSEMGLVDVQQINPNIRVDLKYSSTDNLMNTNVYGNLKRAYLREEIAQKLSRAQNYLTEIDSNLFLLVYDAARPQWVQWKMWNLLDSIPVSKRVKFVSNPKNGSVHNYGAAVDLTICNAKGEPLDMGAGFDDPSDIAYPSKESYFLNQGFLNEAQIKNRLLLRRVMKQAGFVNLETEWWHFNGLSRNAAKSKYEIIP